MHQLKLSIEKVGKETEMKNDFDNDFIYISGIFIRRGSVN